MLEEEMLNSVEIVDYDGKKRILNLAASTNDNADPKSEGNPIGISFSISMTELTDDSQGNQSGKVTLGALNGNDRHKFWLYKYNKSNPSNEELLLSGQPYSQEYNIEDFRVSGESVNTEGITYNYTSGYLTNYFQFDTNRIVKPYKTETLSNGDVQLYFDDVLRIEVNVSEGNVQELTLDMSDYLTNPDNPWNPIEYIEPETPVEEEEPVEEEYIPEPVYEKEPTAEELFEWTEQTTKGKYPFSFKLSDGTDYMDLSTEVEFTDYDDKKRKLVLAADYIGFTEESKAVRFNPLTYNYDIRVKLFVLELPFVENGNTGKVSIGPYPNLDVTSDRSKYNLSSFSSNKVDELELMIASQPKLFVYNSTVDSVLTAGKYFYNGSLLETVISVKPKNFVKQGNGTTKIIYDDAVIAYVNVSEDETKRLTLNLGKWLSDIEVDVPTVSGYSDRYLFDSNGLLLPFKSRLAYELLNQNIPENTSTFKIMSGFVSTTNDYVTTGSGTYSIQANDLVQVEETLYKGRIYAGNINKFNVHYDEEYSFKHDSKGYIKDLKFEMTGETDIAASYFNQVFIKSDLVPRIKQKSTITKNVTLGITGTESDITINTENKNYRYAWYSARDAASGGKPFTAEYFNNQSSYGNPSWLGTRWSGFSGELESGTDSFPMSFTSEQTETLSYHFAIDRGGNDLMNWKNSDYGYIKLSLDTYDEVDIYLGTDTTYWKVERPNSAKVSDYSDTISSEDASLSVGIVEPSVNNDDYSYDVAIKDSAGNVLASKQDIKSSDLTNGSYDFGLQGDLKDNILSSNPNTDYADLTTEVTTKYNGIPVGTESGSAKVEIVNLDITIVNANGLTYKDTKAVTVALTGNNQTIIQGSSDLEVTLASNTFKVADGSSADGYVVTLGSAVREISASFTNTYSFTFTAEELKNISTDSELKVVAKDSRGNIAQISKTVKILSYKAPVIYPKITLISNFSSGVYAEVTVRVSRLNGLNALQNLIVRYRQDSETENWLNVGSLEFTQSSFTEEYVLYKSERIQLNTVDLNTADYYFEYTTYDKLNESIEVAFEGKRVQIAIIDTEKGSFGFGTQPKLDSSVALNTLEVGSFAIFRKTEDGVDLEGTFTLDGLNILEELNALKEQVRVLENK